MKGIRLDDLPIRDDFEEHDRLLVYSGIGTPMSTTITIRQLLGMQQQVLTIPCEYCGSRGKYDIRGNCGACGAPVEDKESAGRTGIIPPPCKPRLEC